MKVTKEKAAENRSALVEAAAKLFAQKGFDGVGIAEICKAAGLTHGALYAQFESKDSLAAAALSFATARGNGRMAAFESPGSPNTGLSKQLDYYLSKQHRDSLAGGCALAASASDAARQTADVRERFCEGFKELVRIVEPELGSEILGSVRHNRASTMVAAMIGVLAVARAAKESHPRLSSDLLESARVILGELGGEKSVHSGAKKS